MPPGCTPGAGRLMLEVAETFEAPSKPSAYEKAALGFQAYPTCRSG